MEVQSPQPPSNAGKWRPRPSSPPIAVVPFNKPASASADALRLVQGHAGDHALVHALLRAANQSPSHEDFLTWLDEPTYEPTDRLLLKQGQRLVAHVQLLARTAWFESMKVPYGGLHDLAVLPEYHQAGYEQVLIAAAERTMRESQAVLSIARTARAEPFRAAGWTDCRGQGYSEVAVSDLLAHLSVRYAPATRRSSALHIRRWRHVELDAIGAVYGTSAARQWGSLYRNESYWRWLVGRKAHSDVIVAVEGSDREEPLSETASEAPEARIVGYAVLHGSQVLELFCLPEFARAAPRLLVRACQDAIEQDHRMLSLHTSASDPLHELIVTAGGTWRTMERGTGASLLVKLLNAAHWIEANDPLLRRRSKRGGLARPLQIGFDTGDEQYRLVMTRRSSRLVADEALRADVRCDATTFAALLVGNLNIGRAREAGRLIVANEDVAHRLAVLFPPCLFWQSRWDGLRY